MQTTSSTQEDPVLRILNGAAAEEDMDLNSDPEEQKRIFMEIASKMKGADFNVRQWQINMTECRILQPLKVDEGAFVKPSPPCPPPGNKDEYPFWYIQQALRQRRNKEWIWRDVYKQREEHIKQLEEENREKKAMRDRIKLPEDGSKPYCVCLYCWKRRNGGGKGQG